MQKHTIVLGGRILVALHMLQQFLPVLTVFLVSLRTKKDPSSGVSPGGADNTIGER